MTLKLKRVTWLLWAVALALGLGVMAWEIGRNPEDETTAVQSPSANRHFDFSADLVQSVTITQFEPTPTTVRLYRQGKDSSGDSAWLMDNPEPVPVSGPGVDFLLSVILGSQNNRDFEVATAQLAEYGLESVATELMIQLVNGKTHRLKLGNPDFQGNYLYALIDPVENLDIPPENQRISLVPRSLEELTRRSPEDWQQVNFRSNEQNSTTDNTAEGNLDNNGSGDEMLQTPPER
ncbi:MULTISPECIES: DUF4340 domain-containing protein [unclassified Synechocystis]|uniref:DUF4340 domain-containing protein n=1 Tax=unclassified Synechocystis TaxID=2640012 RepID=UPI00042367CA|nr:MULTISPECIES: DUF4340 domain-containing protein [unclassified Synechocystis]AIE75837.1 hypothetical protein D082_33090 [Synechocystis sp. PCC 6714]